MVQGYTQKNSGSTGGRTSVDSRFRAGISSWRYRHFPASPAFFGKEETRQGWQLEKGILYQTSDIRRTPSEQRTAYFPKEPKLSGSLQTDRESGGTMLNVSGMNRFYYIRNFTDMRCKHSRVLSIIREQLRREPMDGDVFIVMSKDRRIVRLFSYDNRSYSLFEKKFIPGYQFMRVIRKGDETIYRIDWRDVVLLLENPIIKTLNIR